MSFSLEPAAQYPVIRDSHGNGVSENEMKKLRNLVKDIQGDDLYYRDTATGSFEPDWVSIGKKGLTLGPKAVAAFRDATFYVISDERGTLIVLPEADSLPKVDYYRANAIMGAIGAFEPKTVFGEGGKRHIVIGPEPEEVDRFLRGLSKHPDLANVRMVDISQMAQIAGGVSSGPENLPSIPLVLGIKKAGQKEADAFSIKADLSNAQPELSERIQAALREVSNVYGLDRAATSGRTAYFLIIPHERREELLVPAQEGGVAKLENGLQKAFAAQGLACDLDDSELRTKIDSGAELHISTSSLQQPRERGR